MYPEVANCPLWQKPRLCEIGRNSKEAEEGALRTRPLLYYQRREGGERQRERKMQLRQKNELERKVTFGYASSSLPVIYCFWTSTVFVQVYTMLSVSTLMLYCAYGCGGQRTTFQSQFFPSTLGSGNWAEAVSLEQQCLSLPASSLLIIRFNVFIREAASCRRW